MYRTPSDQEKGDTRKICESHEEGFRVAAFARPARHEWISQCSVRALTATTLLNPTYNGRDA